MSIALFALFLYIPLSFRNVIRVLYENLISDAISFNFIPDSKFINISRLISKVIVFLVFVDLLLNQIYPFK